MIGDLVEQSDERDLFWRSLRGCAGFVQVYAEAEPGIPPEVRGLLGIKEMMEA